METNVKYPKRKPLRLKNYDYSAPGAYFVTICTAEKRCFLSTITVGDGTERLENATVWRFQQGRAKPMDLARPVVKLTKLGCIIERQIEDIPKRFPTVTVDAYVIMPNHIHLLISLHRDPDREDPTGRASLTGRASPSPTVDPNFTREKVRGCHAVLRRRRGRACPSRGWSARQQVKHIFPVGHVSQPFGESC